jgi:hypothetical protein
MHECFTTGNSSFAERIRLCRGHFVGPSAELICAEPRRRQRLTHGTTIFADSRTVGTARPSANRILCRWVLRLCQRFRALGKGPVYSSVLLAKTNRLRSVTSFNSMDVSCCWLLPAVLPGWLISPAHSRQNESRGHIYIYTHLLAALPSRGQNESISYQKEAS